MENCGPGSGVEYVRVGLPYNALLTEPFEKFRYTGIVFEPAVPSPEAVAVEAGVVYNVANIPSGDPGSRVEFTGSGFVLLDEPRRDTTGATWEIFRGPA